MSTAEFTERTASPNLKTGEYRGVQSVTVYSDTRQEFSALARGCGVYEPGWRGKLAVTGKDRVRWLNGMISNNIRDLATGQGVYGFLLNPQGHILGDLYAYNQGESLLLDTDRREVEKLSSLLKRYIIMDKVELSDASEASRAIGMAGPTSRKVLTEAGIDIPELKPLEIAMSAWQGSQISVVRGDLRAVESYEIWMNSAELSTAWKRLLEAGGVATGSEAYELFRIAAGVPVYGQDIRERDLPQETEQNRALHFTKGCYIGQEIVERIRARGSVHRKFSGFRVERGVPAPGAKVLVDGKEVGEITSAASLPGEKDEVIAALGYIRREAGTAGRQVEIGGSPAEVADLPFSEIFAEGV
jgi:aminomethyltransferase